MPLVQFPNTIAASQLVQIGDGTIEQICRRPRGRLPLGSDPRANTSQGVYLSSRTRKSHSPPETGTVLSSAFTVEDLNVIARRVHRGRLRGVGSCRFQCILVG